MAELDFHLDDRGAFDRTFVISEDARLPALEVQLFDNNVAVDLTGATVTFSMENADTGVLKVNAAAAVLEDATAGKVKYEWAAADVDTPARYHGQFKVTISAKDYLIPNNDDQTLVIIVGSKVS